MFIEVPAISAAFAATGGASGSIQVASSAGFYVGAQGSLTDSTGTRNVRCLIVGIPDSTHVVVRVIADDAANQMAKQIYGAGSNLTAYTVANASKLWMQSQLVRVEPQSTAPTSRNI